MNIKKERSKITSSSLRLELLGLTQSLTVRLEIEVVEQDEEDRRMEQQQSRHELRVAAVEH